MEQPFAEWLRAFLQTDQAQHWNQLPRRQRSFVNERQWEKAYPLPDVVGKQIAMKAIRQVGIESSMVAVTPWLLDPEVLLMLSTAVVDYLVQTTPLMPDDLSLPADQRAAGMFIPTEIGPLAPRVALILYVMTSKTAFVESLRQPASRLITQLVNAAQERVPNAPPADIVAVHVLMRRLMTYAVQSQRQRWALNALRVCLPLSPLTRMIEDSDALAALAPYDWTGIESVLCNFGLRGLQNRCAQTLIDLLLPGWKWHLDSQSRRDARFRRVSELFKRLSQALYDLDGVRAFILANWILNFYGLFSRVLDLYQRVVLPPPIDVAFPTHTPSFRLLMLFLPKRQAVIQDDYAGFVAPLQQVIGLVLEASAITGIPIYVPDGLPLPEQSSTHADSPLLRTEAHKLVATWKSLDRSVGPLLSNLYEHIQLKLHEGVTAIPDVRSSGDSLDKFTF